MQDSQSLKPLLRSVHAWSVLSYVHYVPLTNTDLQPLLLNHLSLNLGSNFFTETCRQEYAEYYPHVLSLHV